MSGPAEHSALKVWILVHGRSILHGGYICSLGYFPFEPVVHNWSTKGCGVYCSICGKVHIKDPMLLIEKSSPCGDINFPLKKNVTMTTCLTSNSRWYGNQCALEASFKKPNFPFLFLKSKCHTETLDVALRDNSQQALGACLYFTKEPLPSIVNLSQRVLVLPSIA